MIAPFVIGTETEFFIARYEEDLLVEVDEETRVELLSDIADLFGLRVTQHNRVQLMNGAMVYIDEGHLEYATPPCRSWSDVALHELDMRAVLSEAVARYEARSGDELVVLPPGAGVARDLCGYHENYGFSASDYFQLFTETTFQPRDIWTRVLVPYLVTRIVICGAGGVTDDGFVMSPRASAITHTFHRSSFPERPIVHLRRPRMQDQYLRVHLTCGDPNQRTWPTHTKLATTASVLLAAARGRFDDLNLALADPVASIRALSASNDPRHVLRLRDGREIAAVDILRRILGGIEDLEFRADLPSAPIDLIDIFDHWKRMN